MFTQICGVRFLSTMKTFTKMNMFQAINEAMKIALETNTSASTF